MLYEFRSASQSCLEQMEQKFRQTVERCRNLGGELTVELLGIRPGNGPVDPAALAAFTENSREIIRSFWSGAVDETPCSTDSNVPLFRGIVANTIGTVRGGLSHTRQEWVELESLKAGLKIVLSLMLQYGVKN